MLPKFISIRVLEARNKKEAINDLQDANAKFLDNDEICDIVIPYTIELRKLLLNLNKYV